MALPTAAGTKDELEYTNQTEEDDECVCLPNHGSPTLEEEEGEEEEAEEEFVCLPSYGSTEQEDKEMDEEQQVLCEGSLWSSVLFFWALASVCTSLLSVLDLCSNVIN